MGEARRGLGGVTISHRNSLSPSLSHSWLAEQIDGQMCLYNVGAGKFAVPTSDGTTRKVLVK